MFHWDKFSIVLNLNHAALAISSQMKLLLILQFINFALFCHLLDYFRANLDWLFYAIARVYCIYIIVLHFYNSLSVSAVKLNIFWI